MIKVFKGPVITVYIFSDKLVIEFKNQSPLPSYPLYLINYSEISDLVASKISLKIVTKDGNKVILDISDPQKAYKLIKKLMNK